MLQEVESREILGKLVNSGSDSEFRLLDEKLALIEAQKRLDMADLNSEFSIVKSQISGTVSKVNVSNTGQVVQSEATTEKLFPKMGTKIEASINPKDIAYINKVNQKLDFLMILLYMVKLKVSY